VLLVISREYAELLLELQMIENVHILVKSFEFLVN